QDIHTERHRRPLHELSKDRLPKEQENTKDFRVFKGHSREDYGNRVEVLQGREGREMFERVCVIAEAVKAKGGRALLVGGAVRDEVLGLSSKDFDVEVYGIQPDDLEQLVQSFGKVDSVGKAFGILKMTDGKMDIDVSIPRRDSKVHEGHRGFQVDTDPNMTIREAGQRRDFTFNALSKDPLTGEIFDPFNGVEDLRTRTLRVTDTELFKDDPLRVMRACQFIGRFGLKTDPDSLRLMQSMVETLRELPKERMQEEWTKLLIKSERPSLALQAMRDIGVVEALYPELSAMENVSQEFEWHPEGDVWVHTLMVVDAAREVCRSERLEKDSAQVILFAALCHDLGKPMTTVYVDGRLRSQGHEPAGEKPTRDFLEKIGAPKLLIEKVIPLVREHLWPGTMYRKFLKKEEVSDGAFRRLAKRIHPATIAELTYVATADHEGRGPFLDPTHKDQFLLPDADVAGDWVRMQAQRLGVEKEMPKPILQGRDLIALGLKPGMEFGKIIALSDTLRDDLNWTRETVLDAIGDKKTAKEMLEILQRIRETQKDSR
ncbi:MAG: HD domain-containing protein, partial [Patescibacteria group bacterium]